MPPQQPGQSAQQVEDQYSGAFNAPNFVYDSSLPTGVTTATSWTGLGGNSIGSTLGSTPERARHSIEISEVENGYQIVKHSGYRDKKYVAKTIEEVLETLKEILND